MQSRSRIRIGLVALLALSLRPGAALAIDNSSARISSLGGDHVAGVIPDLYTDLTVNPAYALFADKLVVCYAKRGNRGYAPSLPYLTESSGNFYGSSMLVNELSAWGIRLSSWRAAVFAQWELYRPESEWSDPSIDVDLQYVSRLRKYQRDGSDDFARIDLIAARALGDRYALGFRLQGWGYSNFFSEMNTYLSDEYRDPFFSRLSYQRRQTNARSFLGQRLSFDFQAGIVKSNDAGPETDLALRASLDRLDYRKESYDLDISKEFDASSEFDAYNYYRYHWNDARRGDLWNFALTFRHSFDGGIRVFAGGGVSTCSYETAWSDSEDRVRWGWSSPVDQTVAGAFDGEGSLIRGSCFFKGGKIFNLHETTDLHLGLRGVFARTRTEEEPLVHYAIAAEGEESAVRIEQPTRLESIETSLDLSVPISVEFRPSGFFTFFSSFILTGRWDKQAVTQPTLSFFRYNPPVAGYSANGAHRAGASSQIVIEPEAYSTDWERNLSTGGAVTLGFSLHYRDRFFIDVYSETEIIPTYLANQAFDIRYVF